MVTPDPFRGYDSANIALRERDPAAAHAFRAAVRALDEWLSDDGAAQRLRQHAEVLGLAASAADELRRRLPVWLVERHRIQLLERLCDHPPRLVEARIHLRVLRELATLPASRDLAGPAAAPDALWQALLPERLSGAGARASLELTASRGEALLRVDPSNTDARLGSAQAWAELLVLFAKAPVERRLHLATERLQTRAARRLQQHTRALLRARHEPASVIPLLLVLADHHARSGDITEALRVARRAHRLAPRDSNLRNTLRRLRRASR